jgi:hypothetical protein
MSTEETEELKRRERRERREKRILAQGGSRLERIAGLQGGATAREQLHPDPPEHDISDIPPRTESLQQRTSTPSTTTWEDALSVAASGRNVFGVDGADENPFGMFAGGNDMFANMPEEMRNDPMMRLLLKNPRLGGDRAGDVRGRSTRDSSSEDLSRLAEKINRQLRGEAPAEEEEQVESVPWRWKFMRLVGVLTILGYIWTNIQDYHFSRQVDTEFNFVRNT